MILQSGIPSYLRKLTSLKERKKKHHRQIILTGKSCPSVCDTVYYIRKLTQSRGPITNFKQLSHCISLALIHVNILFNNSIQ